MTSKVLQSFPIILLLSALLIMNILSVRHNTETTDEFKHFGYGSRILALDSNRFSDSEMPFSIFNIIPYRLKIFLQPQSKPVEYKVIPYHDKDINLDMYFPKDIEEINRGRYVTVLFSLLLAFFVFKWAKELYGFFAGLFSLLLYVFDPNIIAHSQLMTTDLYATCMITIATYYYWQFLKSGGWRKAFLSAVILGLSQLTKYTSTYLYPIFFLISFIKFIPQLSVLIKRKALRKLWAYFKNFLKYTILFLLVSCIIINIGFLFNHTMIPLNEYKFKCRFFQCIQSNLSALNPFVPLPYPYVQGLDWVKYNERTGESIGSIYLLGELRLVNSDFKGFPGYYFCAFLFKVPIVIQLFILSSIFVYVWKRQKYNFLQNEMFLFAPILFFTVYFNFFYRCQIGIRHFLIIFPFLYIFCGNLLTTWSGWNLKVKTVFSLLITYLILSVFSYFPHYLSYFNELVWDRKQAYKILADSNLDWGQDGWYLWRYTQKHPEAIVNPESPVAGKVIVRVNHLVGISDPKNSEKYKWLRDNFKPVDHVAYSYLVYEISPEELKKINK